MPMTLQSIPYVGRFTWAVLQAACPPASTPVGATAQVSDIGPVTVHVVNNGTYWRVMAPTDIYWDATTVTGDLTGNDQILKQSGALPAGLLRAGRYFSVRGLFGKDGTTDAATANRIRLGTAGTVADAAIASPVAMTAGQRSFPFECFFSLTSATQSTLISFQGTGSASWANAGTSIAFPSNQITIPNVDSNALYCSLSIDVAGTTNAPQGFNLGVRIFP